MYSIVSENCFLQEKGVSYGDLFKQQDGVYLI